MQGDMLTMFHVQICESVKRNETCFLQKQEWQDLLDSMVIPGGDILSDRSRTSISLVKLLTQLPGIFSAVTSAICHLRESFGSDDAPLTEDIRHFCREMQHHYATIKELRTKLRYW